MDPGGYRAHMIFELAQAHYKVPGLHNALLQHYQVNVADPSSTAPAPALGRTSTFSSPTSTTRRARRNGMPRTGTPRCHPRSTSVEASRPPSLKHGGPSDPPVSVTIPGLGIPGSSASVTIPASQRCVGPDDPGEQPQSRQRDRVCQPVFLGLSGRAALTANGPAPNGTCAGDSSGPRASSRSIADTSMTRPEASRAG